MKLLIAIMHYLPKNTISYLSGWLVRLNLPSALARLLNSWFVFLFGIDMSEAEHPLEHYPTMEAVFTRALKAGSRPIQAEVCSPADGLLVRSLAAEKGQALQVKGEWYSLGQLAFGHEAPPPNWSPAWYHTIYLAPYNYHRVHSPVSGTLKKILYIPGTLWPVNQIFVGLLPKLFVLNERLTFEIETATGAKLYLVMVGALNVGRMTSHLWPELATNNQLFPGRSSAQKGRSEKICHTSLQAGDELGVFMLGSTVVTIFDEAFTRSYPLWETAQSYPIRLGQSLLKGREEDPSE